MHGKIVVHQRVGVDHLDGRAHRGHPDDPHRLGSDVRADPSDRPWETLRVAMHWAFAARESPPQSGGLGPGSRSLLPPSSAL